MRRDERIKNVATVIYRVYENSTHATEESGSCDFLQSTDRAVALKTV